MALSERDNWTAADERETVEAALRGSDSAFETLVRRHQLVVYGYFRPRLIDATDAEDLCQEVFLRSYQKLAKFNHSVPLRAWLIGIARNVLREYVRAARRSREVAWTELCLKLESVASEDSAASGECSGFDNVRPLLPGCMESLGTSARLSLQLHYADRRKVADIAEQLSRSNDAVRLLLYRARKALKRCIDGKLAHGVN